MTFRPDGWFRVGEAAKLLRVYEKDVDRMIRAGELVIVKPERVRFIEPESLAAAIARRAGVHDLAATRDDLGEARDRVVALEAANDQLRARVRDLEGMVPELGEGIDEGEIDPRIMELYQRKDGRWSAKLICPDGRWRRFVSGLRREIVVEDYQKPGRRGGPSLRVRFDILKRDGYRCRYCGRTGADVALTIDHQVAVANGGTDDEENLITACSDCNLGKGARPAAAPP